MCILRIKELEQQLKRRDERLAEIEAKIASLLRYDIGYIGDSKYDMEEDKYGFYLRLDDVLECFQ
jgi:hypothetical protein